MLLIKEISKLRQLVSTKKSESLTIGLVPTMGYLHNGHLELMKKAHEHCDIVIVSIFVNPLQFGVNEDLSSYPRDLDRDLELCSSVNVDVVFAPSYDEIYPHGTPFISLTVSELSKNLCGASRIGHFDGVCTIVNKLFNIVQPHKVIFGRKDIQQLRIIETMVQDLNFPIEVIGCDTVRNNDGLALSSRNAYLSEVELNQAQIVPDLLKYVVGLIKNGEFHVPELIMKGKQFLSLYPVARLGYLQIVDYTKLQLLTKVHGKIIIATAIFIGKTRLIDNIVYELSHNS